ncbi:S41 family peptidase [Hoeflea poritis]|uniref:S41 family peptidase n=1 Tax=Hoeflea poritis TaxID=2993659 RepID=A0ABT4VI77_9HYPH|nr:S41 family peptidase [Hoeflea poritis]MDA4843758.1 S41 family peptidase [Hoeflea poritis]
MSVHRYVIRHILSLFCACGILLAGLGDLTRPASADRVETYSSEEYKADLTKTYELLRKLHPNLTAHKSSKELKTLFEELVTAAADGSTRETVYMAISELVGFVCDEHTQVIYGDPNETDLIPQGWPWFTYPLMVNGGKLYMRIVLSGKAEEVLEIEGLSGKTIAANILKRVPMDGCGRDSHIDVNDTLPINARIVAAMIGDRDKYHVRTRSLDRETIQTREVERAASWETRMLSTRKFRLDRKIITGDLVDQKFDHHNGLLIKVRDADIYYRYSTSRNLAYVGIGSFKDFERSEEGVELIMRDIIDRRPDAIFLDLVDNPGGSTHTGQHLMAFLLPRAHRVFSEAYVRDVSRKVPGNFKYFDEEAEKRRKSDARFFRKVRKKGGVRKAPIRKRSFGKPDYKGKIYVLVSPSSRSNAIRVAATLKRLRKATIVGSVTGTNVVTSCARAEGTYTLEHTGFQLRIPTICFRTKENRFNEEHTLVPDIIVSPLDRIARNYNSAVLKTALKHYEETRENGN